MTQTITLPYTPPYDWPAILAYLGGRAIPGVEVVTGNAYTRTVFLGGRHGTVSVAPGVGDALVATIDHPDRQVVPQVLARLRPMFDLDADPIVIAAALSRDPHLARLVAERPGLRVPGAWDGFEIAVRAILGQQVSVGAATRLAGRLVSAFGEPVKPARAEAGLTHLFPTPDRLREVDVAAALGMPGARGRAISALAAEACAHPDLFGRGRGLDPAVTALKALSGIGEWTAQYIALRILREPDALPSSDLALLRSLDTGEGRPTSAQLLARAEAWRPWRAYAAVHLWASDAARMAAADPSPADPSPTKRGPRRPPRTA
ncbi:DNA-3-methyladenine glycosylase family protein [Methylobacterium marchantiae]|uniref:DNA-3-methyladenine glycosylase II n=1 Tax=Methylobacterium marchantiae TaxID=600331 RepID=A0ABW3WYR9_9HYPH|nr:putative bifunctional transcriptional activator/DNA repair enzyme AlkA [Methylobacterium marchantiae]